MKDISNIMMKMRKVSRYYVKKQKFYLNDESKYIINKLSSKYYRPLNGIKIHHKSSKRKRI